MTDKQGLRSEPRYIVDKTGQIHYSPFDGYVFGNERKSIEPGQSCPTCERRMPYPKRESSPVTKTRSYRVPLDEAEAHEDVLETAAKFLGVYEQPHWVFKCYSLALALVLQDEKLRGFAQRQGA